MVKQVETGRAPSLQYSLRLRDAVASMHPSPCGDNADMHAKIVKFFKLHFGKCKNIDFREGREGFSGHYKFFPCFFEFSAKSFYIYSVKSNHTNL